VLLPRGADRTIDLAGFVGQTYLQAMLAQGSGIFDKTGGGDRAAVTISNADEVGKAVNQFDSKVSNKVFGMSRTARRTSKRCSRNRHVMVNLDPKQYPWEIDLAEVTFLNSYGAPSGMVMQKGALVPAAATAYYAVGTEGSGIGETRADFVKLATRITPGVGQRTCEADAHP